MSVGHRQDAAVLTTWLEAPRAVKTVLLGVFVSRLSGFLNIFIVLYLVARGYSSQQAAFAIGAYGVGAVAGSLVGGAAADRLGARLATVISMSGTGLLTAALLVIHSYTPLLLAIGLVGTATQIYRPASAMLLSALVPSDRQVMIFAMYRFGLNLGATAAPLIGFGLYYLDRKHYGLLFLCEAAFAVMYAFVAGLTLPARTPGPDVQAEPEVSSGGYAAVLQDRRYLVYLVAFFLHTAVYVQYLSTLPLDVRKSGVPIIWYTLAVALNGLIVIAFELPLTKITQRWPARLTIAGGFLLIGCGVAFYGLPLGPVVVLGGTLIWSLGEIVGGPATFAYPAVVGPEHLRGRYLGSFQFMFGLGAAAGPVAGVWLLNRVGHSAWLILASVSVVATLVSLVAVRPSENPADEVEPRSPVAEALEDGPLDLPSTT